MISSVLVNSASGFLILVTVCFTLGDIDEVLKTETGYPFIQVFYNATESLPGTNTMTAILVLTLTASTITEVATASRQLWSFARDRGLPFSNFFGHVRPSQILSSQMFKVLTVSGKPRVEYPIECSDGIIGSDSTLIAHQYRLLDCTSCYRDSNDWCYDVFVHHHH